MELVFIIFIVAIVTVVVIAIRSGGETSRRTTPAPAPVRKSNIRAVRPRVRPTSRRMRTGGTACILHRDDYATDLLFFIALDAALGYDEMHYGTVDFMDSPFLNDEFDYSGSDFEDYAVAEIEMSDVVESDYLSPEEPAPEATSFEELSTDDDLNKHDGWSGDSDNDFGSSDFGGDSDFGGGDD